MQQLATVIMYLSIGIAMAISIAKFFKRKDPVERESMERIDDKFNIIAAPFFGFSGIYLFFWGEGISTILSVVYLILGIVGTAYFILNIVSLSLEISNSRKIEEKLNEVEEEAEREMEEEEARNEI